MRKTIRGVSVIQAAMKKNLARKQPVRQNCEMELNEDPLCLAVGFIALGPLVASLTSGNMRLTSRSSEVEGYEASSRETMTSM